MGFPRAGSNPAGCENYFSLLKKRTTGAIRRISSPLHFLLKGSLYKHLLKVTKTSLLKRIQSQDVYIRNTLCIYFYIYHSTMHFKKVKAAAYFLYYIDIFKHLYIVSAEVNKAVSVLNVLTTQHVNLVACCIKPPVCLINYTLMARI